MGRPQISIYSVLDLVSREMEREGKWDLQTASGMEKIKYLEFKIILVTSEITTSDRKVKDLWKLIEELGIGRKINQSDMYLIDISALFAFLSKKFEYYRIKINTMARVEA